MENKKSKFTLGFVLKCAGFVILAVYTVLLIFGKLFFQDTNEFWRALNLFSKAGDPNKAIRIISYVIFFLGASWIVRFAFKLLAKPLKKGKAAVMILCSLIKYAAVITLIFFILKTFDVDTNAILAGIGILGLIVGLGAQPLIADVLAGLFIVFENLFEVGDIIVVDGFRGTVKEIGIRTTQIEDTGGNIKIINNSSLKTLINMTDQLSLAVCDIGIEYGESLERVEAVLKANLDKVGEAIPDIKAGPFYKGVSELGGSAVVLRFVANCDEGSKYQVERDMNRQFKLLFDANNINIPFQQVVVHEPTSFSDATKSQKQDASKFVKEQKELSRGIADSGLNDI